MKFKQVALGLSVVSLVAIVGCGTDAESDPLTGSWSNTNCFGSTTKPSDIESCTTVLRFTSDLEVELEATWVSLAATATTPGCTSTKLVKGHQWSTDHAKDTFSVTGTGEATLERTKCVNETDNMAPTATSDFRIPSGATKYTLSDDTLTISEGPLKGVYTKNVLP